MNSPQIVVDEHIAHGKVTEPLKNWITAEQIGFEIQFGLVGSTFATTSGIFKTNNTWIGRISIRVIDKNIFSEIHREHTSFAVMEEVERAAPLCGVRESDLLAKSA